MVGQYWACILFPAILLLISSSLALVDALRSEEERRKLHDRLATIWIALDDLRVPDVPKSLAQWMYNGLAYLNKSGARRASAIVAGAIASGVITSQAFAIGAALSEPQIGYRPFLIFVPGASKLIIALTANLVFHLVAIGSTYMLVSSLREREGVRAALWAIALYLGLTFLIGEKAFGVLIMVFNGFDIRFLYMGHLLFDDKHWIETLYALGIFVLIMSYYLLLFALFAAKATLEIALSVVRRFFLVEANRRPAEVAPLKILNLFVALLSGALALACAALKWAASS